ncbi:flagellar export protein FliJ [Dyella koreensis]|uniref:Flagellar FliJ protein n=1 Tax=Dyella koreensis TaxID=311235 RepID=A0ABW8K3T8_9GAMM
MKSRATRLTPAADHAREKREDAAQRLADQQGRLQAAEHQLSELHRYRAEYAIGDQSGGMSVSALVNRQQFLERIDKAIAQQLFEVERQRRLLEQAGNTWRNAHARERALDSVIGQYREQERKTEERREQNDVDERMQHRPAARRRDT